MLRRIWFALIAAACLSSAGAAQPQSPQVRFRTDVDVVRLDVSVLDRNRRPVRGLTAEDFTVLENGRPRPVVAFSAVDVPDRAEPAEGWPREVASDVATNDLDLQRIVVIVMDDGLTPSDPGTAQAARQIAGAVIDRLGSNDLAAVVFTFRGRSQNFTRDRRQLTAAVEAFMPKSSAEAGQFTAAAPLRSPGPPLGCMSEVDPTGYWDGRNCLTETLKNVAGALEDTPIGRKLLVLISSGVPRKLEGINAAGAFDDLQETFRRLQVANVNVYPFDPTGLTAAGIIGPRFDSLRMFAENSGGRATLANNAPWQQVPQVFLENGSYYMLGIQPAANAPARFRRLTVTVKRPDVEVRTRAGYYAPAANQRRSSKPATPVSGIDKAFGAALPSGTLPLSVAVAPFPLPDGKQAAVAITVGLRRPVADTVSVEKLEVRAAAFDDAFKLRGMHKQTVELTLRPNAAGERQFDLQSRLTLQPGRYEVRVAAEGPDRAGGVFLKIDVPDYRKARLALSGLILGRPRNGASDPLADLVPVLPTAARTLSPAVPITAFLRVYQGGTGTPRSIEVRARIQDATGRGVFDEARQVGADLFGPSRAADYRLDLPLARLGAGLYLLTIEATDATKATARREVRFSVDK